MRVVIKNPEKNERCKRYLSLLSLVSLNAAAGTDVTDAVVLLQRSDVCVLYLATSASIAVLRFLPLFREEWLTYTSST